MSEQAAESDQTAVARLAAYNEADERQDKELRDAVRPWTTLDQRVWFPDDQHGYSIALCACEGGAYLGARQMGKPCCCERCGRLTREQWDFLVEHVGADLRMQYEASQAALSDLLTEHRVTVEAVRELAEGYARAGQLDIGIAITEALCTPIIPPEQVTPR